MNERKFSNVQVGLTATALALCGVMVASAMTTSCASSPSSGSGGSNGSTGGVTSSGGKGSGGSGSGGSGSGGNVGSTGGSGDSTGGAGGDSTTPSDCPSIPDNGVSFCNGQAQGLMTGYAYIALGLQDAATQPVCAEDPTDLSTTRLITAPPTGECEADGKTCPTTGRTVWPDNDKLCITGSIPMVTKGDAGTLDYTADWGLQIGVNTDATPALPDGSGGKTLGQQFPDLASFNTITFNTSGTVTPTNTAIRAELHVVTQSCSDTAYCATMTSGKAILLSAFNTACWGTTCGSDCKKLTADDIPNIDKIGVQISADEKKAYDVEAFCLESIVFGTN